MFKPAFFLILILPFFAGCGSSLDCVDGNNIITTTSRQTGEFHSVNVKGSFEVELLRGSVAGIQIKADSNLHALINATVNRGELILETSGCINSSSPIIVQVTSPSYRGLEINGSGSISSKELISTDENELLELIIDGSGTMNLEVFTKNLKADIDGSGAITVKGKTDGQVVSLDGSGKFDAFNLEAKETVVDLSGSGEINVNSSGALTIENSGSGIVRYKGAPSKLSSDISGSGKVVQQQ